MQYHVTLLQPEIESLYSDFLERLSVDNEFVLAYHHLYFRDVLQVSLGKSSHPRYWVVIEENNIASAPDRIVAALPCFIKESAIGPAYCSLPFFGPNAGVLCSYSHPDAYKWHKMLLQAAVEEATSVKAWGITFYTPLYFSNFNWYEEILGSDCKVVDKFTQHMKLILPPVWRKNIRYGIRLSERMGLKVVDDPDSDHADQFWALYMQNCKDYGIPPKPRVCLDAILEKMCPSGLADFYVIVDTKANNLVVAGILNIMLRRTVSCFMLAYKHSYRKKQPMAALVQRAYYNAANRGRTLWNWESSPSREDGVYAYKARWGCQESSFKIYVKPLRPEKEFIDLGQNGINSNFPYFFVYPFNLLEKSK